MTVSDRPTDSRRPDSRPPDGGRSAYERLVATLDTEDDVRLADPRVHPIVATGSDGARHG